MRIAAVGDLYCTPQVAARIRAQMTPVRDEADVLVLAGDLTYSGEPRDLEALLEALVHVRVPTVAVLGNHDYDRDRAADLMQLMTTAGVKVLDGTAYQRGRVGFAGTTGFGGGFGRGALTAFGQPAMKAFVHATLEEALKLESALSFLDGELEAEKTVVVLHYAPIADTVRGEPPELYPHLGSSRLAEVIDRHGAELCIHAHAHHGVAEGRTMGGVPVYNVSLPVLQALDPPRPYRVFEV
ncbi:MAG TPA: metallophosphoesterase [Polyangia bacterium]|jgi:Icc-related predicted phosphoesterase